MVFLQPQYLKLLKASYLLLWHSPSWFSFYHLVFLSPSHPLNTPSRSRAQYMSVIILCLWASNPPFHIPKADAWTWAGLKFFRLCRPLLTKPANRGRWRERATPGPQSVPAPPLITVSSYSNTCKTSLMTPFKDNSTRQAATPPQRSRPDPRSSTFKLHVLVIPVSSLYSLRPIPCGPGRTASYHCYRHTALVFLLAFSVNTRASNSWNRCYYSHHHLVYSSRW